MLIDSGASTRGLSLLSVDDFYPEVHQIIFRAMQAAAQSKHPVDLVTVSAELRRNDQLDSVGGGEYLTALIGKCPTSAHMPRYAKIVLDKSLLRRLVLVGRETESLALEEPDDPQELIAVVTQKMLALIKHGPKRGTEELPGVAAAAYERLLAEMALPAGLRGPRWGIRKLDEIMGGMADRLLVLVEGDTSFGKSSLCRQLVHVSALAAQQECKRFIVYLLEDTKDTWLRFMGGRLCRIPATRLKRGANLTDREEAAVVNAYSELISLDTIHIADDLNHIAEIEADARLQAIQGPIYGILIDHAQLVRSESRDGLEQRFVAVANGLLNLAKDIGAPVILPSQLSRDEQGLTHSKYCRALEEFALVVIEIERAASERKMTPAERRGREDVSLVVKKDRLGPAGYRIEVHNEVDIGLWWDAQEWQEVKGSGGFGRSKEGGKQWWTK